MGRNYGARCAHLGKFGNSFVFFALSQVQCQCIHLEMIQGNESYIQHLREPRQVDQQEFGVQWNSLLDVQHRIELCGDSKVVVNWCEAFWPVRNPRFRDFVQWWHLGCQPRMRHAPWCRHIFREYNSLADKLAGEGKDLTSETCVVEARVRCKEDLKFLRGFWDGAFSSSEKYVGLGWWIQSATEITTTGEPRWDPTPLLTGRGKCTGHSAMPAEMLAQRCLGESITKILTEDDLFSTEKYTPWKHGTKLMDTAQLEFRQEFVPIKQEWRDSIEPTGEWHSASSDATSCSASNSSSTADDSDFTQGEPDSDPKTFLEQFGPR